MTGETVETQRTETQAPTQDPIRTVYIVRMGMSSGSRIADRKEIDSQTEQLTFTYPEEMRKAISSVRGKYRAKALKHCLAFYGLMVAKGDSIEAISSIMEEADKELKTIDPSLQAGLKTIPVTVDRQAQGELHNAMLNAIRGFVWKTMNDQFASLAGKIDKLPERSRVALLKLCDQAKTWNVLGDQEVNQKIANWRYQIEHDILKPVAEEIKREFEAQTQSEGAYIDL